MLIQPQVWLLERHPPDHHRLIIDQGRYALTECGPTANSVYCGVEDTGPALQFRFPWRYPNRGRCTRDAAENRALSALWAQVATMRVDDQLADGLVTTRSALAGMSHCRKARDA